MNNVKTFELNLISIVKNRIIYYKAKYDQNRNI